MANDGHYNINGVGNPSQQPTEQPHVIPGKEEPKNAGAISASGQISQGEINKIHHGFIPNPNKELKWEIKKLEFLDSYYNELTPTHTCVHVGISLRAFQNWCNQDREFARSFQEVFTAVGDRLKRVAIARGIRGSDDLLKFLLRYHDPGFRERSHLDIDPKLIDNIVNAMLDALRKTVPENCPHCKSNLGLTKKVGTMLEKLSKGIAP